MVDYHVEFPGKNMRKYNSVGIKLPTWKLTVCSMMRYAVYKLKLSREKHPFYDIAGKNGHDG